MRSVWQRRPKLSSGIKGGFNKFHNPALPVEGEIKRIISGTEMRRSKQIAVANGG